MDAQVALAPEVDWISPYTFEDDRSESGIYFDIFFDPQAETSPGVFEPRYRTVPLPPADQHYGDPQDREDSGEDWWYGHLNYMVNDALTGYVTTGYASWPNCFWEGPDYCKPSFPDIREANTYAPRLTELEREGHRKGHTRGTVAKFLPDGSEEWYRHLLPVRSGTGSKIAKGISWLLA